jgi:hypothetical protein
MARGQIGAQFDHDIAALSIASIKGERKCVGHGVESPSFGPRYKELWA